MNFDGNNVHILGLDPREQYLLRLLMTNLMAGYIDKTIADSATASSMDTSDKNATQAVGLFIRYADFVDMLCPESMLGRAKSKVLMIKPELMRYVTLAVNGWDAYNNYLAADQRNYLASGFDGLQKKVADSVHFTYNRWEIEKEKQRK